MAQNVTIKGGSNRPGHGKTQGAQKGTASSDRSSAPAQPHATAVRFTDGRQKRQ